MSTWMEGLVGRLPKTGRRMGDQLRRSLQQKAQSVLTVHRVLLAIIIVQWFVLGIFSWYEFQHFALTEDFSSFYQPWYLIAHGHLDPPTSQFGGYFYQNHLTLIIWPLALLYWVYPHAVTLLWIQDTALSATIYGVYRWGQAWLRDHSSGVSVIDSALLWLMMAVLAISPWIYWGAAFDFHGYTLGACFAVWSGYAFYRQRYRWGYVAAFITLLCGSVVAPYLVGIALTIVLLRRQDWWHGALIFGMVVVYFLWGFPYANAAFGDLEPAAMGKHTASVISAGGTFGLYAYLAKTANPSITQLLLAVLLHPMRWMTVLWQRRLNLYANLGPTGILGVFSPLAPMAWVTLAETFLPSSHHFMTDFSQNFAVYPLTALGLVWFIRTLYPSMRRWVWLLMGVILANAIGWSLIWLPPWPQHWVPVSTAAARTLAIIEKKIPPQAEVIASQGIMGRFSNRTAVLPLFDESMPVESTIVDAVISPYDGVRVESLASALSKIQYFATLPACHLEMARDNIWWFQCDPTIDAKHVARSWTFPTQGTAMPGWALQGAEQFRSLAGPPRMWYASATPQSGYVVYGAYWREPIGTYRVSVRLASGGPVNLEVWNATGHHLLLRRTLFPTDGVATESAIVSNPKRYPPHLDAGTSLFRVQPLLGPQIHNNLEIRLWSPGATVLNVYAIHLTPISRTQLVLSKGVGGS